MPTNTDGPRTAAALVDATIWHLSEHFDNDAPVDVATVVRAVSELDAYLTQKKGSVLLDKTDAVKKYLADDGYPGYTRIIYLSDGGLSRLVMPGEHANQRTISLTGPPTPKVAERWAEIRKYTPLAVVGP